MTINPFNCCRFQLRNGLSLQRHFNTKPQHRSRPKIPNTPPTTASAPVRLSDGSIFQDLRGNAITSLPESSLPPLLKPRVGVLIDNKVASRMRQLYESDPTQWSLHRLSKTFAVPRSFVIKHVFPKETQRKLEGEMDKMLLSWSTTGQRGWIMRHKIRQNRESSF